jgi:23S rRNA pseudouridine2605 synthase
LPRQAFFILHSVNPKYSMRLNRYLASAGLGSRRSCEGIILAGRVSVNGKVMTDLATVVKGSDHVTVDGQGHQPEKLYTLAMFKPTGVLCSRDAQGRRKTVFDLLPEDAPRLFYVGRLDMDSEGLLILTNRGELAQQLTHPSYKLPKIYHVELDRDFDFALVPRFLKGFLIEPGYAKAESVFKLGNNRVKIILTQGLKRQIRLMFLKFGYRVRSLRRMQIGDLTLGNMKAGEWRFLSDFEIDKLLLEPTVKEKAPRRNFAKPMAKKIYPRPSRPNESEPREHGRRQTLSSLGETSGQERRVRRSGPPAGARLNRSSSSGRSSSGIRSRTSSQGDQKKGDWSRPRAKSPRRTGRTQRR